MEDGSPGISLLRLLTHCSPEMMAAEECEERRSLALEAAGDHKSPYLDLTLTRITLISEQF